MDGLKRFNTELFYKNAVTLFQFEFFQLSNSVDLKISISTKLVQTS